MVSIPFLAFILFKTLVLLTFDLLDFLWFLLIGFGHLEWWLVVGLLFGDNVVVLKFLDLI
jgi:hypothetical protein